MAVIEPRYAEALLSATPSPEEANKIEELLSNFSTVWNSQEELRYFILDPAVPASVKKDMVKKMLSGEDSPLFENFICLLIDKARIALISVIYGEYKKLKDLWRRNLRINVYSAHPLDEIQLSKISEKYRKQYGALSAEIFPHIDTAILGGIWLQIGDVRIDYTLSGRLKGLLSTFVQI